MTTIAYRAGVLVGDGQVTSCQENESYITLTSNDVKIWRLPDGRLFGGAHASEDIERLKQAMFKNQAPPKLEDIDAILIDRKGRIWEYEGNIWVRVTAKFHAIGSGHRFAIPAMMAGASALQAVKIAISCDPFSGGKITTLRVRK